MGTGTEKKTGLKVYTTKQTAEDAIASLGLRDVDVRMFYVIYCYAHTGWHIRIKELGTDWDSCK